MSIFDLPRFHFKGLWTVNPCTTNNDDVNYFNDYANMKVVNKPSTITTDAEFRAWMMQLKAKPDSSDADVPALINAGWNYFGDGLIGFYDIDGNPSVNVTMGCLPDGTVVQANDPLLNARVVITGNQIGDNKTGAIMVDLDPASNYSVQIFASDFAIETQGRDGNWVTLLGNTQPEFVSTYARYMWISRNTTVRGDTGSSVIWQWTIPKENLTLNTTVNSPLLASFYQSMQNEDVLGIQIQFDCFLTRHKYDNTTLVEKYFSQGIEEENPAYGPLVGTVGLWRNSESRTMPGSNARVLYPIISTNPANKFAPRLPESPNTPIVGQITAAVDTNRKVIILNLANGIPETSNFDPHNPFNTKYDFGDLELAVGYIAGDTYMTATLATLPYQGNSENPYSEYQSSAYQQTGGLVELSYAGSPGTPYVDSGQLQLLLDGTPISLEIANSNIMSDQFGVYVNAGDSVEITIHSEQAGVRTTTPVILEEWRCIVVAATDSDCANNALSGGGYVTCQFTVLPDDDNPSILAFPNTVTTDDTGNATFTIQALEPGISFIRFIPPRPNTERANDELVWQLSTLNQSDPQNPYNNYPSWQYDMYIAIRVLPLDTGFNDPTSPDYISDEDLQGADGYYTYIYPLIFRYYYLLYPGMSKRINFSNYDEMKANASIIKSFVSERNVNNTLYMPITRELSNGKRILIQRWAAVNE